MIGAAMLTADPNSSQNSADTSAIDIVETSPLSAIPVGKKCVLTEVEDTELSHDMRRRMAELGLRAGAELTVCQKTAGGGRVIKISNTRYAIDKNTSTHIIVTPGVFL
ncbi:ferrous iron transport protein A [Corynebacterium kutscheri]|uniref:ferrous iron transport protein A n=1 Tax=Corynebacterium kutscheri TaxID=35755 RepID=UPI0037BF9EA6